MGTDGAETADPALEDIVEEHSDNDSSSDSEKEEEPICEPSAPEEAATGPAVDRCSKCGSYNLTVRNSTVRFFAALATAAVLIAWISVVFGGSASPGDSAGLAAAAVALTATRLVAGSARGALVLPVIMSWAAFASAVHYQKLCLNVARDPVDPVSAAIVVVAALLGSFASSGVIEATLASGVMMALWVVVMYNNHVYKAVREYLEM